MPTSATSYTALTSWGTRLSNVGAGGCGKLCDDQGVGGGGVAGQLLILVCIVCDVFRWLWRVRSV